MTRRIDRPAEPTALCDGVRVRCVIHVDLRGGRDRQPIAGHNGFMGMFTQRPEEPTEWAGLPSEPARPTSAAERLDDAAPVDLGLMPDAGGAVESIAIPVAVPDPEADDDSTSD